MKTSALLFLAAAVLAPSAQAGGVQWSVGIQLPAPPVVVYPAPVYVQQQPQVIYVRPEHREYRDSHRHGPRHWRDDDWRDGDDRRGWRHGR